MKSVSDAFKNIGYQCHVFILPYSLCITVFHGNIYVSSLANLYWKKFNC